MVALNNDILIKPVNMSHVRLQPGQVTLLHVTFRIPNELEEPFVVLEFGLFDMEAGERFGSELRAVLDIGEKEGKKECKKACGPEKRVFPGLKKVNVELKKVEKEAKELKEAERDAANGMVQRMTETFCPQHYKLASELCDLEYGTFEDCLQSVIAARGVR